MSDKGGAYEHSTEVTGFGRGENTSNGNEHAESTIPPTTRNEIDVKERNEEVEDVREPGRTHPHGPETHQDTRVTRKSGE